MSAIQRRPSSTDDRVADVAIWGPNSGDFKGTTTDAVRYHLGPNDPTAIDINQLRLILALSCQHARPSVSCGSEFFLVGAETGTVRRGNK